MRRVYFGSDNIISSLGFSTAENASRMLAGECGIKSGAEGEFYPGRVAVSKISDERASKLYQHDQSRYTRFENLLLHSISDALAQSTIDPSSERTAFLISTTKGNIDLLANGPNGPFEEERIHLWKLGEMISGHFNIQKKPLIISNACTSGSVAIITAARMIASGEIDHAVVCGGDILSGFVVSGFMSFQALSPLPCRPFDLNRSGLSLGEGFGTVILSADRQSCGTGRPVAYFGGATSNDANHISGPSRDGEGLYLAIDKALDEAGVTAADIGFISAHGTATPYNDEMESLALSWAGLDQTPANSFKGYIGHTLGGAGIIETILSVYTLRNDILFASPGYEENGVSKPLNIIRKVLRTPVRRVLKTASGFGGCNAALVIGSLPSD